MILSWTVIGYIFHAWRTLYANLIGRIAFFTVENIAHIEFYLQGLLPKILAIYTIKHISLDHGGFTFTFVGYCRNYMQLCKDQNKCEEKDLLLNQNYLNPRVPYHGYKAMVIVQCDPITRLMNHQIFSLVRDCSKLVIWRNICPSLN